MRYFNNTEPHVMLSGICKQRSDPMSAMPKRTKPPGCFSQRTKTFHGDWTARIQTSSHWLAAPQPHAAALPQICGEPSHVSELRLSSPCLRNEKSKQGAPRIWSNLLLTLIVLAVHRSSSRHLQFKKSWFTCSRRHDFLHALVAMLYISVKRANTGTKPLRAGIFY